MYQKSKRPLMKILGEIDAQREKMIRRGMKYGFTDEITIQYSQELDELLNEYQQELYSKAELQQIIIPYWQQLLRIPETIFLKASI